LDEGLQKEVEDSFLEFLSYTKAILEEELSEIDVNKIEDYIKIVVEQPDLYEDWIEKIEEAPLPDLDKIEKLEYSDGIHLKILYSLKTKEGVHYRKIKIKSNGKVDIKDFIELEKFYGSAKLNIRLYFDVYGNLIFEIKKV